VSASVDELGGIVRVVQGRLADADVQRLFYWQDDVFGLDDHDIEWQPKDVHFLLDVGGELVSHVGLVERTVAVGAKPVRVAGVGAVVTHGDHHGKGYASALLNHAHGFMTNEWRVPFGMLFCRDALVSFYARHGWTTVHDEVLVEQPPRKVVLPLRVMTFSTAGAGWPNGPVDLNGLPW
jgi:predicted GNAT family N-acyltransferase